MNYKKYFITYGDKNYAIQRNRISFQAKKLNIFDRVITYKPRSLNKKFREKFKNVLIQKHGGGFWLWKPFIILETLKKMNEGDILIYVDAGSSINPKGKNRLVEYFEILKHSKENLLLFEMPLVEKNWTSKEVFEYFDVKDNKEITDSNQFMGGVILVKKNKHSINFFNVILNAVESDYKLITNDYSKNQNKYFEDVRHDQSLISVYSKISGCLSLKDESYFYNNPDEQYIYPILTVRDGNYNLWQKYKYYMIYPVNKRKIIFWKQKPYFFKNKYTIYKKIKNIIKKLIKNIFNNIFI